jgi:hypothetical protein
MKRLVLFAILVATSPSPCAYAQFGSGVVFDPTQSGHAVQQLVQGAQLNANTLQEMQTAIKAYNFTREMMTAPQMLYQPFISPYTWEAAINTSANTYNNTSMWTNAANTGSGATMAIQQAYVPRTNSQLPNYGALSTQSQQQIAAQGATSDLNDSVNATTLQTIGTIRTNAQQRATDIANLEAASHSLDPSQQTELATLQRINQALLLMLRTQQETNQLNSTQSLQQMMAAKQQQDALKTSFQNAITYQNNFPVSVAPAFAGTSSALTY